jgi:hypothetical protein
MIEVTKEEFVMWMEQPITQAILGAVQERKDNAIIYLLRVAPENETNFLRGMIQAYTDILDMRYEDESNWLSAVSQA